MRFTQAHHPVPSSFTPLCFRFPIALLKIPLAKVTDRCQMPGPWSFCCMSVLLYEASGPEKPTVLLPVTSPAPAEDPSRAGQGNHNRPWGLTLSSPSNLEHCLQTWILWRLTVNGNRKDPHPHPPQDSRLLTSPEWVSQRQVVQSYLTFSVFLRIPTSEVLCQLSAFLNVGNELKFWKTFYEPNKINL